MKLSIVLCTYNGAKFLPEQLESLLAQERVPDEIIVGDDASTDESKAILLDFAKRAETMGINVRVTLHPSNLGFVTNFSETLQLASGDVIFLSDQDDIWRSDKLGMMESRFEADPLLLMMCSDARLVDGEGRDQGASLFEALELTDAERVAVHEGGAFDVLLRRSMVTGATAGLRREVIAIGLPVGEGWIHDEWLAVVAAAIGRLDALDTPLIDYRQHASNQVGMRVRGWRDKWRDLVRPRRAQFEEEVRRMDALAAHLAGLGGQVKPDCLPKIIHKRAHFATRLALGALPRMRRLSVVLREARAGNYTLYGTGGRSVLRDVLRHD